MISLTIARKYAKALLEIGRREKNQELLGADMEKLAAVLHENKELRGILYRPFYPAPRRKAIAQSVGNSLGVSKTVLDFLNLLIERDRMDHFFAIGKSYKGLCDEASNRLRASLFSAQELPSALVREIQGQLESTTGKQLVLTTQEDSSLIGGVVTKIGNIIYDGSVKTQLLKAKENLYKE